MKQARYGDAFHGIVTEADARLISVRPGGQPGKTLMCAEPSPDVAKALSLALSAKLSLKHASGTDLSPSAEMSSSEALMSLAGRTATVVALRDGLYRACEAYANGIIGRPAYAMILSQYGDLLVTLMLGEAASQSFDKGGKTVSPTAPTGTRGADAASTDGGGNGQKASAAGGAAGATSAAPTISAASFAPAGSVWASAADVPRLRPAVFEAAAPVAATTTAVAAPTTDTSAAGTADTARDRPAESGAEAVTRIARYYWDRSDERSAKAVFVTCVTMAEPGGSAAPSSDMAAMCAQVFQASGRYALAKAGLAAAAATRKGAR